MTPPIELGPILPELILVGTAIVVLLAGAMARGVTPFTWVLVSLAGVVAAAVAAILLWNWDGGLTVLAGGVTTDRFGVVIRLLVLGVSAIGLLLGHHYFERYG